MLGFLVAGGVSTGRDVPKEHTPDTKLASFTALDYDGI